MMSTREHSVFQRAFYKAPSWPDYLKEVARRTRLGFGQVHEELLQRYKELSTRLMGSKSSISKKEVDPKHVPSRVSDQKCKKSKDDTSQICMYPDNQSGVAVQNLKGTGTVQISNEDLKKQTIRREMPDANHLGEEIKSDGKNMDKSKRKAKTLPVVRKLYLSGSENTEHMYDEVSTRHTCSKLPVEESTVATNQPYYSNLDELSASGDMYETVKSPEYFERRTTSENSSSSQRTNKKMVHVTRCAEHLETSTKLLAKPDDDDKEYINMEGTERRQTEDYRNSYENTEQKIKSTRKDLPQSTPYSPTVKVHIPSQQNNENNEISNNIVDNNGIENENEYVRPDIAVTVTAKTPISAAIAPYKPESKVRASTLPLRRRPFLQYTVEEVVECFEECALFRLGNICKEEKLDGEYFRDLSDEDLLQEPFCLNYFYIHKVRKIIAGWRPKRSLPL